MELLNKRHLDRELIPLKLVLGLTSIVTSISLLLPGNRLQDTALKLISTLCSEVYIAIYFAVLGLATLIGLYKYHKLTDYIVNILNIGTWTFLSLSIYFSVYPSIPVVNSAYTVLALVSIWIYTRSNVR